MLQPSIYSLYPFKGNLFRTASNDRAGCFVSPKDEHRLFSSPNHCSSTSETPVIFALIWKENRVLIPHQSLGMRPIPAGSKLFLKWRVSILFARNTGSDLTLSSKVFQSTWGKPTENKGCCLTHPHATLSKNKSSKLLKLAWCKPCVSPHWHKLQGQPCQHLNPNPNGEGSKARP